MGEDHVIYCGRFLFRQQFDVLIAFCGNDRQLFLASIAPTLLTEYNIIFTTPKIPNVLITLSPYVTCKR